jgi:hypothetical protein
MSGQSFKISLPAQNCEEPKREDIPPHFKVEGSCIRIFIFFQDFVDVNQMENGRRLQKNSKNPTVDAFFSGTAALFPFPC